MLKEIKIYAYYIHMTSSSNSSNTNLLVPGNTKNQKVKKKQVSCARHWVFTYNNYLYVEFQIMEEYFRDNSSTFEAVVFQEEVGESNTPHLQGCLTFVNKARPFNLGLSKKIHWEKKGRHSTLAQMRDYCCRPIKRAPEGRVFLFNWVAPVPLNILLSEDLYVWQKLLIEKISKIPNDRDIIWVYGRSGLGKTQFAKYLAHHYGGIPLMGGSQHILSVVSQHTRCKLFMFLATMRDRDKIPYKALECTKDGIFMSHFGTKHTEPVIMNSPHIIVFANYPPRRGEIAAKKLLVLNLNEWEIGRELFTTPWSEDEDLDDNPFNTL